MRIVSAGQETSAPSRPVTLGAMVLNLRQKYGRGFRSAYFRDRIRPRILDTRPFACEREGDCEIHVLTSSADWLNLVWALKSFFHYAERRYPLCIHDDGSLQPDEAAAFAEHFPGARILARPRADREIAEVLQPYPRCLRFRQSNHLAPKVFDFAYYLNADRMLLLDSDVLFFARPEELLRRMEEPAYQLNSVNSDISSAYTVDPEHVRAALGLEMQPRFNSGLGLIHRKSLRLDWIEEFLGLPGIEGHFWRIEQTIYALCSSRFGVELLPPEYSVRFERGLRGIPCRHYVGAIRHLMYSEGMRHLVREQFLNLLSLQLA